VNQSSHGIERSWPLLSKQHVQHSPSRLIVSHLVSCTLTMYLSTARTLRHSCQCRSQSQEDQYVGHVLNVPLPETQKNLLQFIGLANYFRDYVPRMTEMVQPLRKLIPLKAYKDSGKLVWTAEAIAAFEYCQQTISNCQELYFS
jgi:hypothetical protein